MLFNSLYRVSRLAWWWYADYLPSLWRLLGDGVCTCACVSVCVCVCVHVQCILDQATMAISLEDVLFHVAGSYTIIGLCLEDLTCHDMQHLRVTSATICWFAVGDRLWVQEWTWLCICRQCKKEWQKQGWICPMTWWLIT
jgi:hypothetical protein